MKKKIIDSLNSAFEIIMELIKVERTLQIQIVISASLLIFSLLFNFSRVETMILTLTITVNVSVELISIAIKRIVDRVYVDNIKVSDLIKTMISGSVFATSIGSILIGYLLFYKNLEFNPYSTIEKISKEPINLAFISVGLSVIVAILFKTRTKTGRPFQGGIASGHSAIAFSVATSIMLLSKDVFVTILGYFLAVLVAESRVEAKVHSVKEIIIGGLLGTAITTLIFQIL